MDKLEGNTTNVRTEIPDVLLTQAKDLVAAGWFSNLNDLMVDTLRRFLESHQADLMEEFIHQDVEWGLYGDK